MRYEFSKLGVFSKYCQNYRDLRCLFLIQCVSVVVTGRAADAERRGGMVSKAGLYRELLPLHNIHLQVGGRKAASGDK